MLKRVAGTKDILPEEASWWQELEERARKLFSCYNYNEIRTPLIEEEALFNRSLGESTEIIQKQMFLIKGKKGTYALRPEGTASIVRAFIENNLAQKLGLAKLYYIGPMFRKETPQKGRLRQFHHIGCEVIGSRDPFLDAETISLADKLLKEAGVKDYRIKINSLGCEDDKAKLASNLRSGLKTKSSKLCPDCKKRLKNNALRILDCKKDACKEVVNSLKLKQEKYLCPECADEFKKVREGLDLAAIDYEVVPRLVRGLDYYLRTVFEIAHKELGAQDALCAGGRYDSLVSELGGDELPAIGFAFGVERIFMASGCPRPEAGKDLTYIIALGVQAKRQTVKLLDTLRTAGVRADTDYEFKSLKGAMRRANDLAAAYALIIGDDEIKKGIFTIKDMRSGQQEEVRPQDILDELK
ncbi:histidine--tRNA ligase [Candidatus Omnitrophota bacterium]